jgi:hypothetical protein
MIILNVSFGIFAFLPQGWLFMAFVILFESLLFSRILNKTYFDVRIYGVITATNVISGVIGILASLKLNGGWWLVVWFPWVSNNEVNTNNSESMKWLYVLYACAFILTLLIEILTNWIFLRNFYKIKKIIIVTLLVNILSYIVGTFVLYSYSFG